MTQPACFLPGALAWQAAGKAWQSRAPGAETTTKQSHSRLETLLQEIEAQRSKSAASVTADSSRTGLQPATQQQRIVERVPEAAVDNVGYQRGTGDVAATSVWNWETERTPQESAQSAAETTAEVGQLTWTRPIWQPISIPCRCVTSVLHFESQSGGCALQFLGPAKRLAQYPDCLFLSQLSGSLSGTAHQDRGMGGS